MSVVGKSIDDVTTVVLVESGPTLAAAIRDGQVSPLSGAAPDWISLSANGSKVRLITTKEMLASPANTFAVNAETIAEKRKGIEGFLKAWSKGMYVSKVNPEKVALAQRKGVPAEGEDKTAGQLFLRMAISINLSVTERLGDPQSDV
ncbi:MAG: ABC transporter substrate-binding protein [Candidatus Saccharibacteria bacterium]|nr:ABC transporter substrate-binding protein [Pseudorhodobacter sp.]